jgi:hypothetical protein
MAKAEQAALRWGLHGCPAVAALKQTECFAMKKVFTTGQVAKIC